VETELRRGALCLGLKRALPARSSAANARSRELTSLCRLGSVLYAVAVLMVCLLGHPAPDWAGIGFLLLLAAPALLCVHRIERATRDVYLHAVLQDVRIEQLSVENNRLNRLSATDALTGAANRRRLQQALCKLCTQPPCGDFLLLADIDFFKRFNDCHGHVAGDSCLREVVGAIRSQLRRTDLVARFGGEEFAIILPRTTYADALATAERIRVRVASQRVRVNGQSETVTVSIGIAERLSDMAPATLMAHADRALYDAKNSGRNRVSCAEQAPRGVAA
jgi:diguanylate cyclase (GGDEF)-like protein